MDRCNNQQRNVRRPGYPPYAQMRPGCPGYGFHPASSEGCGCAKTAAQTSDCGCNKNMSRNSDCGCDKNMSRGSDCGCDKNTSRSSDCGCDRKAKHDCGDLMPPQANNRTCQHSLGNPPLAMAYVPMQRWNETYPLDKAICTGTIFPCLNKPFLAGRCSGR